MSQIHERPTLSDEAPRCSALAWSVHLKCLELFGAVGPCVICTSLSFTKRLLFPQNMAQSTTFRWVAP